MEGSYHICIFFLIMLISMLKQVTSTVAASTTHRQQTTVQMCLTLPRMTMWEKEYYPNPQTDISKDSCGRGCKKSWICDPGHLITQHQADALDHQIDDIRASDNCGCSTCGPGIDGFTIAIALVPDIKVGIGESVEKKTKEFIEFLSNTTWKFGSCDNDILVLLSLKQKLVRMLAGDTVRETITNGCLMKIQNETNKLLSQKDIYDVLDYLITRYRHALTTKTCDSKPSAEPHKSYFSLHVTLIVVGVVLLICVMLLAVFLKQNGRCQNLTTYRISIPSLTLRVKKPHKHRTDDNYDSGGEDTPMNTIENQTIHDIPIEVKS